MPTAPVKTNTKLFGYTDLVTTTTPLPPKRKTGNEGNIVSVQLWNERARRLQAFVESTGASTADTVRLAIDLYLDAVEREAGTVDE